MRRILWLDALQAAATSAAPVILAVLLDEPRLGWSAIAAFWACFGDPGGPLRQRAGAMLALDWPAVCCLLASVSAPHLWLLLPLTFLCCTLGGLLRVLGPAAAIIGTLLSAGFVVAAELPAPTVVESLRYALFFVAGASWAILMTALGGAAALGRTPRWPWPIATGDWPILPTRWPACIPACAPRLARRHGAPCPGRSGPPCGPRWRRPAAASAKCKARVPRAAPAQQLYYLLDRAEDSFIAMVAAADLLESNAPRWLGRNAGAHLCHALHRYASVCNAIAGTSDAADARQADRLRERLERYGADLRELRGPRSRTRPSWPASFRCWTGCNSPPSPSGRPCSTPPSCRPARHPARPPRRRGKPGTRCARTCDWSLTPCAMPCAWASAPRWPSPCRAASPSTTATGCR